MFEKYNSTSSPIKVNLRQHPKDSNAWNVHIVCKYMLATLVITLLFYRDTTAPSGQGPLIIKASRSHLAGPLWTSDQPVAETSTSQHTTKQTSMPQVGFEPIISVGERARGPWDRPVIPFRLVNIKYTMQHLRKNEYNYCNYNSIF